MLPEHALPCLLKHFHPVSTSVCENLIYQLLIRIPSFSNAESFVSIWEPDSIWEGIYICRKKMDYAGSRDCTSAKPVQMWDTEGFTSTEGKMQKRVCVSRMFPGSSSM